MEFLLPTRSLNDPADAPDAADAFDRASRGLADALLAVNAASVALAVAYLETPVSYTHLTLPTILLV